MRPSSWPFRCHRPRQPLQHPGHERRFGGADALRDPRAHARGCRAIGKVDGNFVVNPDEEDLIDNTDLDLDRGPGTDEAILMVSRANEIPRRRSSMPWTSAHDANQKLCGRSA